MTSFEKPISSVFVIYRMIQNQCTARDAEREEDRNEKEKEKERGCHAGEKKKKKNRRGC
jgi:hypothetical protein